MARPKRGVRGPLLFLGLLPGIGGLRRGAGEAVDGI